MQAIGPFEIVGELGRGCLGVVYEAHTPRSSEPVAVKVPHEAVRSDPTSLERFRRHIATLAGLDHPNIVGFRDAGEDRGIPYLVMERLEGRDLAAVVGNRDAIPPSGKLKLLVRLARALEHVHAKNLVYLNLKTRHVRLLPEGGVKLIDFCLTAPVTPAGPSGGPAALAGTADFPGSRADRRRARRRARGPLRPGVSRLRAAERPATLHGRQPPRETLGAVTRKSAAPERAPRYPVRLAGVVLRSLEKQPDRRFGGAGDLIEALREGPAGGPEA